MCSNVWVVDCTFIFLMCRYLSFYFFFFNDTATTEIYTLSLHDALPILVRLPDRPDRVLDSRALAQRSVPRGQQVPHAATRSEEHTSELQSRLHLVCRLLLEKKKETTLPAVSYLHQHVCT